MENRITEQVTINVPLALFESMQKKWIKDVMVELQSQAPDGTQTDDEYLTRRELSDRLKISLGTLRNRVIEGRIKQYRLHGKVLFKWSEVKEALQLSRF